MQTSASRSPGSGGRSGGYSANQLETRPLTGPAVDTVRFWHSDVVVGPEGKAGSNYDRKVRRDVLDVRPPGGVCARITSTCCATKIRKNGWTVQYVESDRTPFAYTIGLHDWGLPELLVTGVSPPRASRLSERRRARRAAWLSLTPGSQIKVQAGPLIEIVDVDHPDAHMGWAVESGGPDVRARQLVWADGRGRWPWSAAFCDGRRRQPVLGVRARQLPERRL